LSIERTSPEEPRQSIKLTVKAPPSKLREVTNSSSTRGRNVAVNSRDSFEGGEIVVGSRPRKKAIVEESSEDEEEDQEENDEEEEEDEDAEGEEDEEMGEDDDAEGEEDEDMVDAPPPLPPLPYKHPKGPTKNQKPSVKVTAPLPSVEDKEMALDDDDDDELSDLPSGEEDAEGEPDDEDGLGEEDAEGEEVDDFDSEEELMGSGSRSHTPDPSKMTRRQRHELDGGQLMALSNEAQKKKHLTAEEHAMRRAEMARRRKNLSEKRNEEEKVCCRWCSIRGLC